MIRFLIIHIIRLLNLLVPKNPKLVVFISDPDYADNPLALYEWLVRSGKGVDWELKWMFRDQERYIQHARKHVDVFSKSFAGLWNLLRAKVIITSHNQFGIVSSPERQVFVSLGHGIYLKNMGYMKHRKHLKERERKEKLASMEILRKSISMMVATSGTFKMMLAACYHVEGDRIEVAGFPRMDDLFRSDRNKIINNWFCGRKVSKLFLYIPTHRRNEEGGLVEGKSLLSEFFAGGLSELQKVLEKNDSALLIKLHPFEQHEAGRLSSICNYPRIAVVGDNDLYDFPLYQIVGAADCLVTDYSSVYIEYLALDRPIVFTATDLGLYEEARGLLLSPYEQWTPGPKVKDLKGLCEEMPKICGGEDDWQADRKRVRDILIAYPDGQSAQRVWSAIEARTHQ